MNNESNERLKKMFKLLHPKENLPEKIKEDIMDALDTLDFFGELADLFTVKFAATEAVLLDSIRESEDTTGEEGQDEAPEEEK